MPVRHDHLPLSEYCRPSLLARRGRSSTSLQTTFALQRPSGQPRTPCPHENVRKDRDPHEGKHARRVVPVELLCFRFCEAGVRAPMKLSFSHIWASSFGLAAVTAHFPRGGDRRTTTNYDVLLAHTLRHDREHLLPGMSWTKGWLGHSRM